MPDRRFTEEEARRVFAAVAERKGRAQTDEPGLSLTEMQEAASASGLDPALVALVVAEQALPEASGGVARVLGVPAEVRRVRVLLGPVTDAAWERIVADLRATFKTPGNPSQIGRVREWTGGDAYGTSVRVAAEPLAQGGRVVIEQSQAQQGKAGAILGGIFSAMAVLSSVLIVVLNSDPDLWGLVGVLSGFAVLSFASTWGSLRAWEPRKAAQMDALLDRIDLTARDKARPLAPEAARLDIDARPDAPEASGESRTPTRARS